MPQISTIGHLNIAQLLSAFLILGMGSIYLWAWVRGQQRHSLLAGRLRLGCFLAGLMLLWLALVWPVPLWAESLLTGRSIQKALVAMVVPPLLWLGLPFHVVVRTLPASLRRHLRLGSLSKRLTAPPTAWLVFISVFLLWHDPAYVNWSMDHPAAQSAAAWLLLLSALLFWQHVVNTGPRIHSRMPSWIMAIYLLGVEIPNMAAGITIALTMNPIYHGYAQHHQLVEGLPFNYASDQMIGGAIIWVFGSVVYIGAIIGVLYRLFRREGDNTPRLLVGWDDAEKTIAPGLEHRVRHEQPDIPWQSDANRRTS